MRLKPLGIACFFLASIAEGKGASLAVKPGLTLPTGDEAKGLGAGKTRYALFLLATADLGSSAVHLNAGFKRNENSVDERKGIWHVSVAGEAGVTKNLKVVGNVGTERNTDRSSRADPAFGLVGLIYSVSESLSLDAGVKAGLNGPETDSTFLAGLAYRF
ncbi:MAG: hypothetical protein A2V83_09230 [Nitrospirae bacterium RBG_16_64_22]|nr:MAG: hypothetical protein A2V83_09230 [Nitrospirae bacterium RBG_16_64_22]